ncbi:GxxExxY protein [Verrucomicrobiaceae bacterium N1E253]|uniref:GxxExxY protein n=1 Tax=Oceaniferula marina TaxID=2748318 RepID=A0A851GEV8_9BACT|nr:GxxExxY protein [Oceaniferula marina]NWK55956.1 GxxExxY protein [Oceaniferula marina]
MSLLFEKESYAIRGACFEVYRDKGCGFLEDVYQECLEIEFEHQNIPYVAQPTLELGYRGKTLRQTYKPDFICYGEIILEIKAAKNIGDSHRAQLHNYLKATRKRLGFLVNFSHHPKIEIERIIL